MSNNCLFCQKELTQHEVWKDVSPYDSYCIQTYSAFCCPNENCKKGQQTKQNQLAELDYWKKLSEDFGVPDLNTGN